MDDTTLRHIALMMTVNCVRNTIIEDYHADGKLSDDEMMAFNKDVHNKIYTFLKNWLGSKGDDLAGFFEAMSLLLPSDWDKAKIDTELSQGINALKRSKRRQE